MAIVDRPNHRRLKQMELCNDPLPLFLLLATLLYDSYSKKINK